MNTKKLIDDEKTREYCGAGIYAIINKKNGKIYVGSSNNISARIKQHELSFKRMTCNNKIAKDILAGDEFYSEILEEVILPCTVGSLLKKEKNHIIKHNAVKNGYNIIGVNYVYNPEKVIKNQPKEKHIIIARR